MKEISIDVLTRQYCKWESLQGEAMNLLDRIYDMSNLIFLSDLKIPVKLLQNIDIVQNIPDEQYSLEEWEYVYQFIIEKEDRHETVQEIKNALYQYAINSKQGKELILLYMEELRKGRETEK